MRVGCGGRFRASPVCLEPSGCWVRYGVCVPACNDASSKRVFCGSPSLSI